MTRRVEIDIPEQRLRLLHVDRVLAEYPVSTSRHGPGERDGSGCTPRGLHRIRARIGDGAPLGAVFRGRRWTGELCTAQAWRAAPERDWILTRILWLSGLEPGRNRFGEVDTMRRYIYIHGAPDAVPMGTPGSAGCIRMRNADVVELFDAVQAGTEVFIRG